DELLQNSQLLTNIFKDQKKVLSKTLSKNKELISENEKLKSDNLILQKEKFVLENNFQNLEKNFSEKLQEAQKEKSELQKVSTLLRHNLEKMANGSKNLDLMLGGLRPYGEKSGLGFEEKVSENSAATTSKQKRCKTFCRICCKRGHAYDKC